MKITKIWILVLIPFSLWAKKEIYIDLTEQKLYAIEDGDYIFNGSISSGKPGHETPTGKFTILQKKKKHVSNMYPAPNGGAKMPYMMRLTWDGVAMHQGYVAKHPASHGCIRLKRHFAKKLFTWADKGIDVTIAGDINRYYPHSINGHYSNSPSVYYKDRDGYSIMEVY